MFDTNYSEENVQITSSFSTAGNSCIYLCNQKIDLTEMMDTFL